MADLLSFVLKYKMAAATIMNCYLVTLDDPRSLLHGRKSVLKFHVNRFSTFAQAVMCLQTVNYVNRCHFNHNTAVYSIISLRHNIQNAYSSTILVGIRPSLNIVIYCIVRPKDPHVGGYCGGGVGGTPPPEIFWQKMLFFTYFTKIRTHRTTKKEWVGTPSPRCTGVGAPPPPPKFFLHSKLGLARCFHSHFAMVRLSRFGLDFDL